MTIIRFNTQAEALAAQEALSFSTRIINFGPNWILVMPGHPPKDWTDEAIEAAQEVK
jgi:hypothetical protein